MTNEELTRLNNEYIDALLRGASEEIDEIGKKLINAWADKYNLD